MLGNIKKVLSFRKSHAYLFYYHHYYKKLKILKNTILMESTHGQAFNGHLYYMAKTVIYNYPEYTLYIASREPESLKARLKKEGLDSIHVVLYLSKAYCRLLASCQMLINDTTFLPFFNKKAGQKYINIWHGTPLKTLGKDMEKLVDVANVQRNFYMADAIITSNQYTEHILVKSHNLAGIYQGKMITAPSPRNSILFSQKVRKSIRTECGLTDKNVYVYMPTWRGQVGKIKNNNQKLLEDLRDISDHLGENDVFYVKLHPFQSEIDLSSVPNIRTVPDGYELYEFLTAADVLITDYSSIMYDFMNTGRPIIIYAYDKEDYYHTRGAYEDISSYPFPIAYDIHQLINLLASVPKAEYDNLRKRFCYLDCPQGNNILCKYLFRNESNDKIIGKSVANNKETVIFFCGGLWDNGITTALLNTLENIDTSKRNYLLIFGKNKLKTQYYFRLRHLPEHVQFYPVPGQINGSIFDRFINRRYLFNEKFTSRWIEHKIQKLYKYEVKRIFGDLKIDWFIHYTGFERKYAKILQAMNTNTMIFVHTDMFQEYQIKHNFSKKIIFDAYRKATTIALVNQFLVNDFVKRLPFTVHKIRVMNNFLGEDRIRRLAHENLIESLVNVTVDYASNQSPENIIDDPEIKKLFFLVRRMNAMFNDFSLNQLSATQKNRLICESLHSLSVQLPIPDGDQTDQHSDEPNVIEMVFKALYPSVYAERHLFIRFLTNRYLNLCRSEGIVSLDAEQSSKNTIALTPVSSLQSIIGQDKVRLLDILLNPEKKVFINIGRYDYQKGHARLIHAFEKMHRQYPNSCLIIVAPHGPLKQQTIELARQSSANESIFLLGRMSNPYTLLKYCDAFVLSSIYEGLGLVAYEALAVKTDLITVNLAPTTQYLSGNEGMIVENSVDGLYEGLITYMEHTHKFKPFDFQKQKQRSIRDFETLFLTEH